MLQPSPNGNEEGLVSPLDRRKPLNSHSGGRVTPQGILERDNFTLEDILDEDDVIQECKSLNTRLIVL
eukprot:1185386-Prorocentrum_minimum.AAC.1